MMERFEKYVFPEPNSGCWLWIGCVDKEGYGRFKVSGCPDKAHRVSWALHYGAIPEKALVCHHCDVRSCVNPEHLFLGSDADNMADRDKKGRNARGAQHGRAKLTPDQVMAIRASGKTQRALAREFGVSVLAINSAKRGITWKNVK